MAVEPTRPSSSQQMTMSYFDPWGAAANAGQPATGAQLLPAPHEQTPHDETPRTKKRPRVALACQRCKSRKQKCDGRHPCSKCAPSNARCEYVVPQKPMPFGKNQYIKSLERRVAELETLLAHSGVAEVGADHWRLAAPPGQAAPGQADAASTAASSSLYNYAGYAGSYSVAAQPPIGLLGLSTSAPAGSTMAALMQHESGPPVGDAAATGKITTPPSPRSVDPDEAVLDWQDGMDSVVSVLRSLSLDVNGSGYIGASSHVALGRLFSFLNRGNGGGGHSRHRRRSSSNRAAPSAQSTAATSGPRTATTTTTETAAGGSDVHEPIDFADVPARTADRLVGGYMKNIMTRFPVVHSVWLYDIHRRRTALTDVFEATILHLVYATSGRFIETTGEAGAYHVKRHYAAAMRELDTLLEYNDIRTVQALLLMGIYCLRDPAGPGAWTCSRMALLVAIDHGLHRQTKAVASRTLESELRKRLFWACYAFDRQISIPMGRPLGIADRDIDIALPLDIEEATTEAGLEAAVRAVRSRPADASTLMTSFVLICRLRRIESDIQETIYRVDRSSVLADHVIDGFLERLEQWKATIPHDARTVKNIGYTPYDGYHFYMVFYYKCLRLLLYPLITDSNVHPRFLKACAAACAGVCGAYKILHQTLPVGYSFMALQNVFLAGLTLVYCIWLCPGDIFNMATSNGIHDCSIVLFVIAERVPAAAKYRNAFELIRQRAIDQMVAQAPDHRRPRAALTGLTEELAPSVQAFEVNMPFEVGNGSFEQFAQIIADMSGGGGSGSGVSVCLDAGSASSGGHVGEDGSFLGLTNAALFHADLDSASVGNPPLAAFDPAFGLANM